MPDAIKLDYERAVHEALTEPGKLHAAYSAFHGYSFSNQILAMIQLGRAEPINTLPGWNRLGRRVIKGQHPITLYQPGIGKKTDDATGEDATYTYFFPRKKWFGLSQTHGDEYTPEPLPGFDIELALAKLEITRTDFAMVDGNTQGYAIPRERRIAVSPIAFDPSRTLFHEAGHVLLHGDEDRLVDGQEIGKGIREAEAELTSYLVRASLGITEGQEYSRGYLQHWLQGESADKIRFPAVFQAVDKILKAGTPSRPEISADPSQPQP